MRKLLPLPLSFTFIVLSACGVEDTEQLATPDASVSDVGPTDTGASDSGATDATPDAGPKPSCLTFEAVFEGTLPPLTAGGNTSFGYYGMLIHETIRARCSDAPRPIPPVQTPYGLFTDEMNCGIGYQSYLTSCTELVTRFRPLFNEDYWVEFCEEQLGPEVQDPLFWGHDTWETRASPPHPSALFFDGRIVHLRWVDAVIDAINRTCML